MPQITFINRDGSKKTVDATNGTTLLEVSREHDIDIEGACGGCLSCATCHLIVDEAWYGKLPPPKEDEVDMLDLAYNLTPHSRLGCQIIVDDSLEGLVVTLGDEG